jgi:tRNA-splicing ligase RtcB
LAAVCQRGVRWALENGYAVAEDLRHIESGGVMAGADFSKVSPRAKERGRPQLGTLGAGNHFVEVGLVDAVYDLAAAQALGLAEGQVTLLIHTGSRGFGHQICSDYVRALQKEPYVRALPDRDLAYAPLSTRLGQDYLAAMRCAANFAFTNRQLITYHARAAFEQVLRGIYDQEVWWLRVVYDLHHNTAKVETHTVDGKRVKVCVHRKGATRAFGPGHPDLPPEYRPVGQPVLVPGSMGTASWVLVGTEGSMARAFGSTCHGAGRVMSRAQAKKRVRGAQLLERLEADGVHVRAGSMRGLAEEAPFAYKDVDLVVESVVGAGLGDWRPALDSYCRWVRTWWRPPTPPVPRWFRRCFNTPSVHDHASIARRRYRLADEILPRHHLFQWAFYWKHADVDRLGKNPKPDRWYRNTLGDYDYEDRWGGLPAFREEIARATTGNARRLFGPALLP